MSNIVIGWGLPVQTDGTSRAGAADAAIYILPARKLFGNSLIEGWSRDDQGCGPRAGSATVLASRVTKRMWRADKQLGGRAQRSVRDQGCKILAKAIRTVAVRLQYVALREA